MKKTILVAVATLSTLAACSSTFADFDCSSASKDTIKTLLDKQKAGTTLTTDESTLLTNAKTCFSSHSGSLNKERGEKNGSGKTMPEMTDEQKAQMETIKTILEKKKAGTILTSEEQALIDSFEANKPKNASGSLNKERGEKNGTGSIEQKKDFASNLKASHKKSVDNIMSKFEKSIEGKDDTSKKTSLTALLEKVEKAQTKIENSSMSDSKKATYTNILEYLQNSIENAITDLENTDEVDALSDLGL